MASQNLSRADTRLAQRGGWVEVLRAPAALFGAIARARGSLYARGVFSVHRVDVPVVSVGNLSAGGTGKTPMIAWLARDFLSRGLRPGIVSRGYRTPGGAARDSERHEDLNDEARMLNDMLPEVPHVQDRDRVSAAQRLAAQGVDVVLVDDGFQHRRLGRDVDVVLLDALRPFGLPAPDNGGAPVEAMLPRGLMREPLTSLRRADAIVLTRTDAVSAGALEALEARLRRLAPGRPIAHSQHAPVGLRSLTAAGETARPLGDLSGLEVDLFSGIGNPGAFEATARGLGAVVRSHRAFGDHYAFGTGDLDGLGVERPALTTAKDAARLTLLPGMDAPANLLVLDVELDVTRGAEELRQLVGALHV